jgi:hypothetical protein
MNKESPVTQVVDEGIPHGPRRGNTHSEAGTCCEEFKGFREFELLRRREEGRKSRTWQGT